MSRSSAAVGSSLLGLDPKQVLGLDIEEFDRIKDSINALYQFRSNPYQITDTNYRMCHQEDRREDNKLNLLAKFPWLDHGLPNACSKLECRILVWIAAHEHVGTKFRDVDHFYVNRFYKFLNDYTSCPDPKSKPFDFLPDPRGVWVNDLRWSEYLPLRKAAVQQLSDSIDPVKIDVKSLTSIQREQGEKLQAWLTTNLSVIDQEMKRLANHRPETHR